MRALAVIDETIERPKVPSSWDQIDAAVPKLEITMLAYLAQVTVSFRPATVTATATDLRICELDVVCHLAALVPGECSTQRRWDPFE